MRSLSCALLSCCLILLSACHDHAPSDDTPSLVFTHFAPATELFVEFPALVVGAESPFAAHMTDLATGRALSDGRVTVQLAGGPAPLSATTGPSPSPGIFRPVLKPGAAGSYRLVVLYEKDGTIDRHDLGDVTVYPSLEEARTALPERAEDRSLIAFLKEQQWQLDFATQLVERRALRPSIPAPALVRGRVGGEAFVAAAAGGRVELREDGSVARLGQSVRRGDVLAHLVPRLAGDFDVGSLRAEVARARAESQLAASQRRRVEQLRRNDFVSAERLEERREEERAAQTILLAAEARLAQATGSGSARFVAVTAPIDGIVAAARIVPGQEVEAGSPLFHIVDASALRLEAHVAEADAPAAAGITGAWFTLPGSPAPVTIAGDSATVAIGTAVDPQTHTLPVIFDFPNPGGVLVGQHVLARLRTGAAREVIAVPASAIVDEAGQEVVFVLADGEHFQRRLVRTGIRDAGLVEVRDGVRPGERVVSRGAYLVRLAAAGPAAAGHGHAH